MLGADEHTFACSAHAMMLVVLFETLQAGEDRRVFFGLGLFGDEGVVLEWIEANCLGLLGRKAFGENRSF